MQECLGLKVTTLSMPATAKAFIALMMTGLVIEVVQFVGCLTTVGETDPVTVAARFPWLGPLREVGLGLLLAGIVLALATIAPNQSLQGRNRIRGVGVLPSDVVMSTRGRDRSCLERNGSIDVGSWDWSAGGD